MAEVDEDIPMGRMTNIEIIDDTVEMPATGVPSESDDNTMTIVVVAVGAVAVVLGAGGTASVVNNYKKKSI